MAQSDKIKLTIDRHDARLMACALSADGRAMEREGAYAGARQSFRMAAAIWRAMGETTLADLYGKLS